MDYGYHHAPLYSLCNSSVTLTSSLPPSYHLDGPLPFSAALEFQSDPLLIPSDQQTFQTSVDEGSGQFDPLYASLNIPDHPNHFLQVLGRPSMESSSGSIGAENFGSPLLWNDAFVVNGLDTETHPTQHLPMQMCDGRENEIPAEHDGLKSELGRMGRGRRSRKRPARQVRGSDTGESVNNNSVAESLTWEMLSQYFYMPIAQAARELNIGLTLFKKRCRELGVRRWPHRKLMSIKSLIKNVQEMENDGTVDPALSKGTVRSAIEVLEKQRKMMEVMPDIQLEAQTKRLRQACFKANYKKRRLMIMNGCGSANSSGSSSSSHGRECHNGSAAQDFEDSDDLKSLLFDTLSPSECSFLNDYI